MAYIEVEVDINIEEHLDEVSVSNLLNHLNSRTLSVREKTELQHLANGVDIGRINISNLIDEIKLEAIIEGLKNKSLTEIQEFFK